MYQEGELVVFKSDTKTVYEVANYFKEYGYDIWNEDEYFLCVDAEHLQPAEAVTPTLMNR